MFTDFPGGGGPLTYGGPPPREASCDCGRERFVYDIVWPAILFMAKFPYFDIDGPIVGLKLGGTIFERNPLILGRLVSNVWFLTSSS